MRSPRTVERRPLGLEQRGLGCTVDRGCVYVMNQPTWAVLVLAGLAAGCELVAGIQDKYLATADGSGVETAPPDTGSSGATMRPTPERRARPMPRCPKRRTRRRKRPTRRRKPPHRPTRGALRRTRRAEASRSNAFTPPDAGTTDPSAPCSMQPRPSSSATTSTSGRRSPSRGRGASSRSMAAPRASRRPPIRRPCDRCRSSRPRRASTG